VTYFAARTVTADEWTPVVAAATVAFVSRFVVLNRGSIDRAQASALITADAMMGFCGTLVAIGHDVLCRALALDQRAS
jgi:hypothetical protein